MILQKNGCRSDCVNDLARCISAWLETKTHPDSGKIHIYAWQEATKEILDIIDGKVEPYKVLQ